MKRTLTLAASLIVAATSFAEIDPSTQSYKMIVPVTGMAAGGSPSTPDIPETPEAGFTGTDVSCGLGFCYALIGEELYASGTNNYGQLGVGDKLNRNGWTATGLTNVTQFVAGKNQGYVISNGELYVTGSNKYGALGDESCVGDFLTWTPTGITNIDQLIATGINDNAGYIKGGELFFTGRSYYFESGLGTRSDVCGWQSTGLTNVTKAAIGYAGSMAIVDGELWNTGWHSRIGEASKGDWSKSSFNGASVTDIAMTFYNNYVISGGKLYVTGYNSNGEAGLSHNDSLSGWVESNLSNVTAIIGGSWGTAYAISNGELFAAGKGSKGQHGNGLSQDTNVWSPTGMSNISAYTADYYSIQVKQGEDYYYAGFNNTGMNPGNPQSASWTKMILEAPAP